ncbi:hypothetical protein, partial [Pseudovibrio exalbescens]|uniref:hypothetical protein n=2 Tax=Pseudovibrio exalbescens TaxID=197461 RepID=UPI000ACB5913
SLTTVSFEITDLPNGAQFSTDGGTTFSTANISGGTLTYTGPASGLANLVLSLPADFSTENPQTSISGTFTANTDEGGTASEPFGILVNFEPDIILSAPDVCINEDENGNTVDLGISTAITDADLSEGDANTPDTVTITFDRLPDGTTANGGTLDVAGLSWTGSVAEANQLALTFPEDFSTESEVFTPTGTNLIVNGSFEAPDLPKGDWGSYPGGTGVPGWSGTRVEVQDRYQGRVASDGDQYAEIDSERAVDTLYQDVPAETGETYLLSVDIAARRGGTETIEVYWNNQKIATLDAQGPDWVTHTFKVTGEAGLDRLEFRELASENDTYGGFIDNVQLVKGDFAPGEPIKVTTAVTTPEGQESVNSTIKILPVEDIDLKSSEVYGKEDADGPGDSGVTVALAIDADISDADGSEGNNDTPNTVVLTFDRLPTGTIANGGLLDVGNLTWTGSVNEANALTLTFPADFSTQSSALGLPETPIMVTTTVTTPEGKETMTSTITVKEASDIDIDVKPIVLSETDAPVPFKPADSINVTQSDADGSEVIESITVTFSDLPQGTSVSAGSLDGNGDFTFTGTPAEFAALEITLPTDFSTQNPGPVLQGTVTATSNEGTGPIEPITLSLAFEGDVAVGYTDQVDQSSGAPTIVLSETDTGTDPLLVSLGDYFTAQATDADGSESLTTVSFEITDLPDGAQFSTDGGTTFSTANISGGVLTYTGPASGLANLVLSLPADFSTENPLTGIGGTFTANTDEGGTASEPFGILVNFEPDIELSAQDVTGTEDGDGAGVTVDLGLAAAITDADLSEGDANTPDTVTVTFDRLPDGTTANGGTLDVAGLSWTGSVAEANQLALTFPEDFSTESGSGGTDPIMVTTTVTTSEGKETVTSTITVKEASDIDIDGQPIALSETDAPVPFKPADYISVTQSDADGSEVIESITVTFSDLPQGTSVSAGSLDGNGNFT